MPLGFGLSVGDFIAGINLIRNLIKALEEGAGSGQEYRELIRELYSLERALVEIKQLNVDESLNIQKNAIEQAACQCQETISTFLAKLGKFHGPLSLVGSGSAPRDVLRKMQWAVYKKEDIIKFRAQIAGHTSSLLTLLATLQMYVST
jgi:STAND-like protein